ncbi:coatomer gamma subunit appendage platform subdomain-domain-containing protein, partial [Tuber borchii]
RLFNTSPIPPLRCRILLTKITYLLNTGERFPTSEATSLLFGVTKLFQHRDAALRQMVYLVIKEDTAEDVIMVTSSVMTNVAGPGGWALSGAIRELCRIIDGTTVQAIERLLKTAIEDKTPSVSLTALVSPYHLRLTALDVVRRWANETQEAVLSGSKFSAFLLADEDPGLRKPMYTLLDSWLRHRANMVNFEAAKAICDLRDVTDAEVVPAIHGLILHNFASIRPAAVSVCNIDIETLTPNTNRSIATFSSRTLLKTGKEGSLDRLMGKTSAKWLTSPMSSKSKLSKPPFPSKQSGMLSFLSSILRDEAVVKSLFGLIKFVPESKEEAPAHLCEFIKGIEFTKLAVRILHLIGIKGPKTFQPKLPSTSATSMMVRKGFVVLLTRRLDDPDHEVRDRAPLNLRLIQEEGGEAIERLTKNESTFSLPIFEHQLVFYLIKTFDISGIPIVPRAKAAADNLLFKLRSTTRPALKVPTTPGAPRPPASPPTAEAATSTMAAGPRYGQQPATAPEIKPYGLLLKPSRDVELTEEETEYVVTAIKHIFQDHPVPQFNAKNTLTDTILEDASLVATPADPEDEAQALGLVTKAVRTIYGSFKRNSQEPNYAITTFANVLKFTTGEPEDQGFEDEYQLTSGDYVILSFVGSFRNVWKQITETFFLGTGVKDAREAPAQSLSLQPLKGSDVLFGQTISGRRVIAQIWMAYSSQTGVGLKITGRNEEEGLAEMVVGSVA